MFSQNFILKYFKFLFLHLDLLFMVLMFISIGKLRVTEEKLAYVASIG